MFGKNDENTLICPTCMQKHDYSSLEEMQNSIATNYSLIDKDKMNSKSNAKYHSSNNVEYFDNEEHENENFNVEIETNAVCARHSKPIHSYIKTNKALLCSICISESGYEQTKYKPITQVVKEKRGCMNSHKLKLNQNLLQLKRFKDHIEFIKDENIRKVANRVNLHFSNIFKIVEDAEKRAMKKLESYHKTQEKKVKELFDDLKDIEEVI